MFQDVVDTSAVVVLCVNSERPLVGLKLKEAGANTMESSILKQVVILLPRSTMEKGVSSAFGMWQR